MKNINKYFYIFCLFIFMTMVSVAQNVSYRIDSLLIDADVQKNGSIYVNEIVVYDIDYINGILYDIDAKDDGGIKNLVISEADLVKGQDNLKFTPISNSNYEIHEYDGLYKIKIYSKNSNKKKVFLFSSSSILSTSSFKQSALVAMDSPTMSSLLMTWLNIFSNLSISP